MSAGAPTRRVLLLTGPTGGGKSDWALRLAAHLPIEIISADSAQVFRGLDIGTAKPSLEVQQRVPHHLLDIRDPAQRYSAGEFVRDANAAIKAIIERGRLPVLVGGTMLYLRALLRGLAELPQASPELRAALEAEAARVGWAAMHTQLAGVDPQAAAKIHPRDPQRIQRALEVHRLTGCTMTELQSRTRSVVEDVEWLSFALIPQDRAVHVQSLSARFAHMMTQGLLGEVATLYRRGDLQAELPALRSVGYRQLWAYLAGQVGLVEAQSQAVVATCQLAKRQLTWLRGETAYQRLDPAAEADFSRLLSAIRC